MGSACYLSFTLFFAFSFITCTNCIEYLKLPLVQKNNPLSLPAQLLSSDTHRLSLKSPLVSGASTGSGQYFVDLRIGSPPQSLLLVADTGSDLVWSSCRLVPHPVQTQSQTRTCNQSKIHSPCLYSYSYVDGSTTSGLFSKETTTFNTSSGRVTKVKDFSFGCGFRVSGPSVTGASFNGAQGVLGLGRGTISFSSQLGRTFGNRFSYCLLDYTISPPPKSFLTIGASKRDAVSRKLFSYTPLVKNPLSPTFYYIAVESLFVEGAKLPISPSVWTVDENGNGGTVVDSGTTLTFLAEPAYRQVLAAFRRRVRLPPVEGANLGFDLCVNVTGAGKVKLPKLSFSFSGKSVMSPPARNYFIEAAEGVKCVAIQAVKEGSGFSVIGNLMQQGYLFEFDRDRSRLGFTRHGCTLP
ncbi:hypothetical protein Ahy_A05g022186 isoform A [Arachis hypogaea]|uniref:Peptidase A1 domain-containing protein n=1 Tax=Arachis hypogaea TaxID=3818 RepID=A0A445CZX5_ARAHY|nr:hypothetical protein Ahy_A05g022186 isoform A [Arachis hypogaea]